MPISSAWSEAGRCSCAGSNRRTRPDARSSCATWSTEATGTASGQCSSVGAKRVTGPRIVIVEDAEEIGKVGADLVADAIARNPAASITAATGASPMGLYSALAGRYRSQVFETNAVTVFQLDEYLGLMPGDRRSLLGWMRRSFLQPLGVDGARVVPLPSE